MVYYETFSFLAFSCAALTWYLRQSSENGEGDNSGSEDSNDEKKAIASGPVHETGLKNFRLNYLAVYLMNMSEFWSERDRLHTYKLLNCLYLCSG